MKWWGFRGSLPLGAGSRRGGTDLSLCEIRFGNYQLCKQGQAGRRLQTAVILICGTGRADSPGRTMARMKRDTEPQEPSAGPGVNKWCPSSRVSASFLARPLCIEGNRHSPFLQSPPGLIRAASRRDSADGANSMNSVLVEFSPSPHSGPSPHAPGMRHLIPAWRPVPSSPRAGFIDLLIPMGQGRKEKWGNVSTGQGRGHVVLSSSPEAVSVERWGKNPELT